MTFKEACEKIIWSDCGKSDTSSTYETLAEQFDMPVSRVKKKFKEILYDANVQMAVYGIKDQMTAEEIDKDIKKINRAIFRQLRRKRLPLRQNEK